MDGCAHNTPANSYTLSFPEDKKTTTEMDWDENPRASDSGKPSDVSWGLHARDTETFLDCSKPEKEQDESSHSEHLKIESSQLENDKREKNDVQHISRKEGDTAPYSSPRLQQFNLNVTSSKNKSYTAGEEEIASYSAHTDTSLKDSNSHVPYDSLKEAGCDLNLSQVSQSGSPHSSKRRERSLDTKVIPHITSRSPSPTGNLGNQNEHDNLHMESQCSQPTDRISGKRQVHNAANHLKKQTMQTHSDDSEEEEGTPKTSFMARFPIIPNGKGSTSAPRLSSHQNPTVEDSESVKPNTFSIASITSPAATAESLGNLTSSICETKRSSNKPTSPALSPSRSRFQEEAEIALVNQLQLPSDVLYLRQQEVSIHGTPNLGWVVCCAIPLPQNSSLGPFQGQLVAPEDVKVGDLIVQVSLTLPTGNA
ncbi:hypothetical protein ElyMa_003770300 [Elysia marginata]|uniref:PDZ domain-containing protein n=1 Tax=Elysia marginata TaxID=1093978 RepID=A0AAV4F952_9GAST|nr:hypothetical protein ElyMa_003770300 [Elysia marginata]